MKELLDQLLIDFEKLNYANDTFSYNEFLKKYFDDNKVVNTVPSMVSNGVETNKELPRECCIKDKLYNKNVICGCTGNFCSQNGEQVDSIFS